jgi:uncharacterized protein YhaN
VTSRLTIEEIWADTFGGLRNTKVELGSGGLVVVAGLNESGKTSLSELMSWLLVGPSGKGDDALRFGGAGEQIGGRIRGTLRDEGFQANGSFKVLKNRAPNEGGLEVTFGGQSFDAEGWRGLLSGIDASMLDSVYLMWGAELHDGDSVMSQINEAALGGVPGSGKVGSLRDELEASVKASLTSKARGVDSLSALQLRLKACKSEMREIRLGAGEYADLQRERERIRSDAERMNGGRQDIVRKIAARDVLLTVTEERRELEALRVSRSGLDTVPDSWDAIVRAPDALVAAVNSADDAEDKARKCSKSLVSACDLASLAADEAADVVIGQPDVVSVNRMGQELSTARKGLDELAAVLRGSEAAQDGRQRVFEQALAQCEGQTTENLRQVRLDTVTYAGITADIALWAGAEGKIEEAGRTTERAERQVAESNDEAQRSRDAWERFGAGCTAQEWLRNGGTKVDVSTPGKRGRDLWVFAVAAAVSIGASFVLPRIAWSVVTVATFAFAYLFQRSVKSSDDADGVVSETSSDAAREAAEEVVRSEGVASDAEGALSRARRDFEAAERNRDGVARTAKERASASGVEFPFGHSESKIQLDAINTATNALGELDSSSTAMARAKTDCDDQHDEVDRLAREVRSLLDDRGVPDRVQVDDAPAVIGLFQDVTVARQAVDLAERELAESVERYTALVAPVAEEIDGETRQRVIERCQSLVKAFEAREESSAREMELVALITKAMSGDDLARELERHGHSKQDLEFQNENLREQLSEVDDSKSDLQRRIGAIGGRLEQLAQESKLAKLSVEAGALEDASDDQVVAAAANAIALSLLTRVAEEERQANQPTLVKRASELLSNVQSEWEQILVSQDDSRTEVSVRASGGLEVSAHQLSTGARALVYLALRLAMADQDAGKRGFRFPIICDDPLIHIDDKRARMVLPLLAEAAKSGHQVVLFTCQQRTVEAAEAVGAHIVPLGGGID